MKPAPEQRHLPFPLTDIQQAYWLGRSGAFPLGGVGIHGYAEVDCEALDLERLEAAWARVVAHHEMLRAVVLPDGTQRILPEVPPYPIRVEDVGALPAPARQARLEALREELSHQVFAPERWPLFELRATRLGDGRTRLHVSLDGLNVDLWSVSRVLRDWVALYREPSARPVPLAVSFRDYALALEARRDSEEARRALRYWRERLPGLPPGPRLPEREVAEGPARRRFVGRRACLPAGTWAAVKSQAARHGLTPSGGLLAAYAEALAGWSRSPRFTLNVTLANRLPLHPEVEHLVGDFTSMLPLEVDGASRDSFGERARRLQAQLWRDLNHREVSGVQLLRELARERGQGLEPLFPVVFTGALGTPGFRVLEALGTLTHAITQTPQLTLDYQAFEVDGALCVHWDVAEERFPPGLVDALFEAHSDWLGRLADGAAWSEVRPRLLPRAQREAREAVNATRAPPPPGELSAWVAQALRREPRRPAVLCRGFRMERGTLAARAGALARDLREAGAARDVPVAVVMEKGWEQVVAVLGILEAGAAYLPIDPGVPPERLRALLRAEDVPLAVTQGRLDARLGWPEDVRRLCVEDDVPAAPEEGVTAEAPRPEDLAYVLYTSGSTGTPKGVMIERRAVSNRMEDMARRLGLGPEDRVLALTALHHDLSVFDLFGMLGAGAQLVLPDAEGLRDPGHWADRMAEEGVTVWNSVPAFMEMLVEHLESTGRAAPAGLRWVLLSGDRIPVSLPERVRRLFPDARVLSLGGPTETTVWDIAYPIGDVDPGWRRIPYGRPLANARYHVLGPALEPRPDWVPGELYIGGAGLARGYWKDAALTAERFIVHPETGERLYRSGDVGFVRPDGNIDLVGREDRQVKLRGERLQLEEVEATLRQHPRVRAAGVTVAGDGADGPRLVAHVVLSSAEGGGPRRLEPGEALALKLERPGVRGDLAGRPAFALDTHEDAGALARRSHRRFLDGPVALERLGRLLDGLRAVHREDLALPRYRYPSAGSLYPVQVYVAVKPGRVAGLPGGTYYHHPDTHRLVLLSEGAEVDSRVHAPTNRALFEGSAFSLFLVCELAAMERLYGGHARDFCLIEAGCIVQLLMTGAASHGLGLCPVGGLDFERVRPLLGLTPAHLLLHGLCGGEVPAGEAAAVPSPWLAEAAPVDELRAFVAGRLPRHMVPSRFIPVDRLPLTANGKVDARALATAARGGGEAPRPAAAMGPLEALIASAWGEVLRLEPAALGPDDNPFEHGAHSLHAVRVHALLLRRLERELEVTDLFRHPTARALAAHLGSGPQGVTGGAVERARLRRERASRRPPAEGGAPGGTA